MTQICHFGDRLPRCAARRCLRLLALIVCAGAMGCRHRTQAYRLPLGPQAPVALEELPADEEQEMIATLPLPELGPLPSTTPAPPVQRRRQAAPREETSPAAVAPVEAAPADVTIGSLSTGAGATPQIQQQAQTMISSLLKRIASLPNRTAEAQRGDVNKVRNFLNQAQQAFNTGDMDGAKNLAVKASVLMDDLEKR